MVMVHWYCSGEDDRSCYVGLHVGLLVVGLPWWRCRWWWGYEPTTMKMMRITMMRITNYWPSRIFL